MPIVNVLYNFSKSKFAYGIYLEDVGKGLTLAPNTQDVLQINNRIIQAVRQRDLWYNDDYDALLVCDVYVMRQPGPSEVMDLDEDAAHYRLEILSPKGTLLVRSRMVTPFDDTGVSLEYVQASVDAAMARRRIRNY